MLCNILFHLENTYYKYLQGGIDSGFRKRTNSTSEQTKAKDGVTLFQIRGTNELNTRAVEVIGRAASLNSNDVFLMQTPEKAFVWEGSVSYLLQIIKMLMLMNVNEYKKVFLNCSSVCYAA